MEKKKIRIFNMTPLNIFWIILVMLLIAALGAAICYIIFGTKKEKAANSAAKT